MPTLKFITVLFVNTNLFSEKKPPSNTPNQLLQAPFVLPSFKPRILRNHLVSCCKLPSFNVPRFCPLRRHLRHTCVPALQSRTRDARRYLPLTKILRPAALSRRVVG